MNVRRRLDLVATCLNESDKVRFSFGANLSSVLGVAW